MCMCVCGWVIVIVLLCIYLFGCLSIYLSIYSGRLHTESNTTAVGSQQNLLASFTNSGSQAFSLWPTLYNLRPWNIQERILWILNAWLVGSLPTMKTAFTFMHWERSWCVPADYTSCCPKAAICIYIHCILKNV